MRDTLQDRGSLSVLLYVEEAGMGDINIKRTDSQRMIRLLAEYEAYVPPEHFGMVRDMDSHLRRCKDTVAVKRGRVQEEEK